MTGPPPPPKRPSFARRPLRRSELLLIAAVAGLLAGVFGTMARPGPYLEAGRARLALGSARAARAGRLAPEAYREAELAYLAADQALARAGEQWFPRYGRARALYRRAYVLADRAGELARQRDRDQDQQTVTETLDLLRTGLARARAELEDLIERSADDLVPEVGSWYHLLVAALAERVADVERAVASDDLVEAAARAAATWAQLSAIQEDLVAWRLALDLRGR